MFRALVLGEVLLSLVLAGRAVLSVRGSAPVAPPPAPAPGVGAVATLILILGVAEFGASYGLWRFWRPARPLYGALAAMRLVLPAVLGRLLGPAVTAASAAASAAVPALPPAERLLEAGLELLPCVVLTLAYLAPSVAAEFDQLY